MDEASFESGMDSQLRFDACLGMRDSASVLNGKGVRLPQCILDQKTYEACSDAVAGPLTTANRTGNKVAPGSRFQGPKSSSSFQFLWKQGRW